MAQLAERVVLLDGAAGAVGTAPKAEVHHRQTPLHLAFSCYVVDADGRVLLTRRADAKATWPGVWTNSCCGHPLPDEPLAAAVRRRLQVELGLEAAALDPVLPRFRYRAAMANGVVEHEVCPVFRALVPAGTTPRPNPDEVSDTAWAALVDLQQRVGDLSPWCAAQLPALVALGADPRAWPAADPADLPFGGSAAYPGESR